MLNKRFINNANLSIYFNRYDHSHLVREINKKKKHICDH